MATNRNHQAPIYGFHKTEHFLLRQHERVVEDKLLYMALRRVGKVGDRNVIVVCNKLINRLFEIECEDLILRVRGRLLITCYYGDIKKCKNANDKILLIQK
jgi:hypothetical protein